MMRQALLERKTNETDIKVELSLDGTGQYNIKTGIGFFDHMLEQFAKHSLIDLSIKASGDLHVDAHHLAEDVGITLGKAFAIALESKVGIRRYGSACIPMDEALTRCVVDLSDRPFLVFNISFKNQKIGEMDAEVLREFFAAFADNSRTTLHIENLYGRNDHHLAESAFKAFARAVRSAIEPDPRALKALPSTKGVL